MKLLKEKHVSYEAFEEPMDQKAIKVVMDQGIEEAMDDTRDGLGSKRSIITLHVL
jgi:hypothetical protein